MLGTPGMANCSAAHSFFQPHGLFQALAVKGSFSCSSRGRLLMDDVGSQRALEPFHVVGAEQVHQRIVQRLRIVHPLGEQEIPQGARVDAAVQKSITAVRKG